jgi:hypothetical protein
VHTRRAIARLRRRRHVSLPDSPLGDAIDTFVRREDAERFIAKVKRDDPLLASHLRVVELELEAGERN